MEQKYLLAQQLLTWTDGSNIQIGLSGEHARTVSGVDRFMIDFFRSANEAKTLDKHTHELQLLSQRDHDICASVVDSFVEEGIIRPELADPSSRYNRHDLYYALAYGDKSESAQLGNRKVAIIGVGGIGSNVATILCAAGVGELLLVDDDVVELTNLTRQYLFSEKDVGQKKVDTATRTLQEKNHNVAIRSLPVQVEDRESLKEIFDSVDLSIISADSSSKVMDMANSAALETGKPFMPAGYQDTVGVVGPFFVPSNEKSTCLTCAQRTVFDNANEDDANEYVSTVAPEYSEVLTSRYQAPSFGPLNLMVSSIAANEAIGFLLTGESRLMNSRANISLTSIRIELEEYAKDANCPDCSRRKAE